MRKTAPTGRQIDYVCTQYILYNADRSSIAVSTQNDRDKSNDLESAEWEKAERGNSPSDGLVLFLSRWFFKR